jgi:O-antigen ligase
LPFLAYGLLQILRGSRSRGVQAATILTAIPVLYVMLWVLAASGSRNATLATLVGAGAFFTFSRRFEVSPRAFLRLALAVAMVSFSGYVLYQSSYFPSRLRERIELSFRHEETLTVDRVELARAGWQAPLASPFLGVGLDNFRHVSARYGVLSVQTDPHNMWIDLLAKVGLFGIAALFSVVAGWVLVLFGPSAPRPSPPTGSYSLPSWPA